MKTIEICIEDILLTQVKKEAAKQGITVNQFIVQAIQSYLKQISIVPK